MTASPPTDTDMFQHRSMNAGDAGAMFDNMHNQQFRQTNPLATASLTIAIAGLFLLPIIGQIASIICGAMALNQIGFTRERGKGLALAGIILSAMALVIITFIIVAVVYYLNAT